MNERIQNQIAEMKKQTIGVEVEMNNITRREAAKTAAEFFGTGRFKDTAATHGYYTWSAWDAQNREGKFSRDSSIAGPDEERCDMITPILTYDDMDALQELIRRLRKADELGDELILQMGGGGLLAAHAGADAALVAGSLLALETKHV